MKIYRNNTSVENAEVQLAKWIGEAKKIVFFGGAGVSTESGVPDFRSEKGLYQAVEAYGYPPETILSRSFFLNHPEIFFKYYFEQILYPEALPNPAHLALAQLESSGAHMTVITQNIDGLHQAGGSKRVVELHGSVHRNYCTRCGETYNLTFILAARGDIPKCLKCQGTVRPDVVLYEEPLDSDIMEAAVQAVDEADLLMVGGTSLVVYPAAGLVRNYNQGRMVLINKSATPFDGKADLVIKDNVATVLDQAVSRFLKSSV
jgi:NAD-dependent deacetylase